MVLHSFRVILLRWQGVGVVQKMLVVAVGGAMQQQVLDCEAARPGGPAGRRSR